MAGLRQTEEETRLLVEAKRVEKERLAAAEAVKQVKLNRLKNNPSTQL